jgi:enolase
MSLCIRKIQAYEILDSRGNPTIAVALECDGGATGCAQAPSGASTGRHEAVELRDGDPNRYAGKGVLDAVHNVNSVIARALTGRKFAGLPDLDAFLIELDGAPDKSRLGANAILGVSCAAARALANARREPLWRLLETQFGSLRDQARVPLPMVNILSGGLHAGSQIDFQDFLIIPHGCTTFAGAMECAVAVHRAARSLIIEAGFALTGVADEGGWAPRLPSNESALRLLTDAIARAGYKPGEQVSIAIDAAATHFYRNGLYRLATENRELSAAEVIHELERWTRRYPVVSIEDGLAEDDWENWVRLTAELGARVQLIGDDLFTTTPDRLRDGVSRGAANSVLVKMNQIGTLTETFAVLRIARDAGYSAVVSARSGETEDSFLADLAVASGAGQIKVGSITRSERLAKYNRLLEIEALQGLPFAGPAPLARWLRRA